MGIQIRFSSHNQIPENGSPVYAIWYDNSETGAHCVAGYINRTRRKSWQIDILAHMKGRAIIKETAKFKDAKQIARELLA